MCPCAVRAHGNEDTVCSRLAMLHLRTARSNGNTICAMHICRYSQALIQSVKASRIHYDDGKWRGRTRRNVLSPKACRQGRRMGRGRNYDGLGPSLAAVSRLSKPVDAFLLPRISGSPKQSADPIDATFVSQAVHPHTLVLRIDGPKVLARCCTWA